MNMRTIRDVIDGLPVEQSPSLPKPDYEFWHGHQIALALESYNRHMTDEGEQLQRGWERCGVDLWGYDFPAPRNCTNVKSIIESQNPAVCFIQDNRDWDRKKSSCFVKQASFTNLRYLRFHNNIFRVALCKDAHSPERQFYQRVVPHAVLVYYHPEIVCHLSSCLRPEHCIRIYHSVDRMDVPEFSTVDRSGILLSGAIIPRVYPLRFSLRSNWRRHGREKTGVTLKPHPGYNAKGSHTKTFLRELSRFKVSICTTSIYGYSLRKIIESVACGCVVVTDLPIDDVLPEIDDALIRVTKDMRPADIFDLCREHESKYDSDKAKHFADKAKQYYDWRASGRRQIEAVETMRSNY